MPADHIRLKGIRVQTRVGHTAEERVVGHTLEVDVDCEVDTRVAADMDSLGASIDYAAVAQAVVDALESREFVLLETAADAAAAAVLGLGVEAASVRVRKPSPPMPVATTYAEVEVHRP